MIERCDFKLIYLFYDKQNLIHFEIKLGAIYEMDTTNNHCNS